MFSAGTRRPSCSDGKRTFPSGWSYRCCCMRQCACRSLPASSSQTLRQPRPQCTSFCRTPKGPRRSSGRSCHVLQGVEQRLWQFQVCYDRSFAGPHSGNSLKRPRRYQQLFHYAYFSTGDASRQVCGSQFKTRRLVDKISASRAGYSFNRCACVVVSVFFQGLGHSSSERGSSPMSCFIRSLSGASLAAIPSIAAGGPKKRTSSIR